MPPHTIAELVFLSRLWLNCYELPERILVIFNYITTLRSSTDIFPHSSAIPFLYFPSLPVPGSSNWGFKFHPSSNRLIFFFLENEHKCLCLLFWKASCAAMLNVLDVFPRDAQSMREKGWNQLSGTICTDLITSKWSNSSTLLPSVGTVCYHVDKADSILAPDEHATV